MQAILRIAPLLAICAVLMPAPLLAQQPPIIGPQDLPPQSCLARAGSLTGSLVSLPKAIDGTKLKKPSALKRLRKQAKDGQLLYIKGGNFTGWQMRKVKQLSNVCFEDADFSRSNWEGMSFSGLGFINSKLSQANLKNTQLPHVLFRTTSLDGADASSANFSNGQMDGGWSASLAGLNATGAKFNYFRFNCGSAESNGCPFDRQGVKISGADFSNASLSGFALWDSDWTDVKLDGAIINLEQAGEFSGAAIDNRILILGGTQLRSVNASELKIVGDFVKLARTDNCESKGTNGPARHACDNRNAALAAAVNDVAHLDNRGNIPLHGPRSRASFSASVKDCMQQEGEGKTLCLQSAYNRQRNRLIPRANKPEWAAENDYALFVKTDLNVGNLQYQNTIAKIAPVVAGASNAVIMMKRDATNGAWQMRSKLAVQGSRPCYYASSEAMFRNGALLSDVKRYRRSRKLISGIPAIQFFGTHARFADSLYARNSVQGKTLAQCPASMQDGLKKIPVSQSDFNQLWQMLVPGPGQNGAQTAKPDAATNDSR